MKLDLSSCTKNYQIELLLAPDFEDLETVETIFLEDGFGIVGQLSNNQIWYCECPKFADLTVNEFCDIITHSGDYYKENEETVSLIDIFREKATMVEKIYGGSDLYNNYESYIKEWLDRRRFLTQSKEERYKELLTEVLETLNKGNNLAFYSSLHKKIKDNL